MEQKITTQGNSRYLDLKVHSLDELAKAIEVIAIYKARFTHNALEVRITNAKTAVNQKLPSGKIITLHTQVEALTKYNRAGFDIDCLVISLQYETPVMKEGGKKHDSEST